MNPISITCLGTVWFYGSSPPSDGHRGEAEQRPTHPRASRISVPTPFLLATLSSRLFLSSVTCCPAAAAAIWPSPASSDASTCRRDFAASSPPNPPVLPGSLQQHARISADSNSAASPFYRLLPALYDTGETGLCSSSPRSTASRLPLGMNEQRRRRRRSAAALEEVVL